MKIVILGSGNVATHLAKALNAVGEEIMQIYSPNIDHAKKLANDLQTSAISDLKQIYTTADLYVIAVKDDFIQQVAEEIAIVEGLVVHTSGATDIKVFPSSSSNVGVFYPLQTFSKEKLVSFKNIPLCIEANTEINLTKLHNLASKLSDKVYQLDGEKRHMLHLAAVFACNFTNYFYSLAHEILEQNQLDFDIIRPLIAETADKVMVELPENVQTGPAIRNDENTMNKHFNMLSELPELQQIYQYLSNSIKKAHI